MERFKIEISNYPASGGTVQYRINSGEAQTATVVSNAFEVEAPDGSTVQLRLVENEKLSHWSDVKSLDKPVNPISDSDYALSTTDLGLNAPYVMKVRRDSDSTEQNFTAGEVIDGTLTSFCGVGNGFVVIWYDQLWLGRNALQPVSTKQPKIVDSGALIIEDGQPVIDFDGVDDFMQIEHPMTANATFAMKLINKAVDTLRYLFGDNNGGTSIPDLGIQGRSTTSTFQFGNNGSITDISTPYPVSSAMNIFIERNSETNLYINDSLEISQTLTPNTFNEMQLGAYKDGSHQKCAFSSFIAWNKDKSAMRSEIQTRLNA